MLNLRRLDIDSKPIIDKYIKNKYENSESSFANLFIWSHYYNTLWGIEDEFLVILNTSPDGRVHCYMPYGKGDIKSVIDKLMDHIQSLGQELRITNATKEQADMISELYPESVIEENRNFEDYVYLTKKLKDLSGRELHSKRNHLNKFKSLYSYSYRTMEKSDFSECLSLAGELISKDRPRGSFGYEAEMKSIQTAFENFDTLGLSGGVIEIDGRICAFSVGEELTDKCAVIHIEKADTAYNGIYSAINNEFAKNRWSDYEFINREEDMGIEGLRKAKLSYKPHHLVEKYICRVR